MIRRCRLIRAAPKWFPPIQVWVSALLVVLFFLSQSWKVISLFFIFFSIMSVQWLKWVLPLKHVTIEGDYFRISNSFVSHRVPVAHLAGVTEIRAIRDNGSRYSKFYLDNDTHEVRYMASPEPAIDLYFETCSLSSRSIKYGKYSHIISPPILLICRRQFRSLIDVTTWFQTLCHVLKSAPERSSS
jgi:hypothetical protein